MEMLIFGHMQGCTPLTPCASCEIIAFLKQKLKPDDYEEFTKRVRTATQSVAGSISAEDSINVLGLGSRTHHCLENSKLLTVGDVLKKTRKELLHMRNFGSVSLKELEEALHRVGRRIGELSREANR